MNEFTISPIAHIRTDFPAKFGIPRQAGIVSALEGKIVFEPEYRNEDALRGLESFSHIWVIWQFSESLGRAWSPTVRPPRLGGNERMGVFATRSPFRPNSLGLSCLELLSIEKDRELGSVLRVAGADMLDNTPIFDIKPYVPYADSRPDAKPGFAPDPGRQLDVEFAPGIIGAVPESRREALRGILANDPRPRYQNDSGRIYAMEFAGLEIKFAVDGSCLRVSEIYPAEKTGGEKL